MYYLLKVINGDIAVAEDRLKIIGITVNSLPAWLDYVDLDWHLVHYLELYSRELR